MLTARGDDTLLVDLTGRPGVGKTTLVPLLREELRRQLGWPLVAMHRSGPPLEPIASRRRRIRWLATHPHLIVVAWIAGRRHRWRRWLADLVVHSFARASGHRVVVSDSSVMQVTLAAGQLRWVPRRLLPDVVLEITCDDDLVQRRRTVRALDHDLLSTQFRGLHLRQAEQLPAIRRVAARRNIAWYTVNNDGEDPSPAVDRCMRHIEDELRRKQDRGE